MTAVAERETALIDKTPPQNIEAEQSVLGAMMLSRDAIGDVSEVLRDAKDFYRPAHESIYTAIADLYVKGEPVDPITVSAELTRLGTINKVGGFVYLHTLISSVPTAANARYYAEIVRDKATLRRLVTAAQRMEQMGYGAAAGDSRLHGEVDEVVDRAQAELFAVTERRNTEDYVKIDELVDPVLSEVESIERSGGVGNGIRTGFWQFDDITGGLHPGQMVIVAGRPGSGKSTLAMDCARSASIQHGKHTAIFSLEMSRSELVMRLFCAEAGVSLQSMRSGKLNDHDWSKLARRSAEIADAPLWINDSANLTMMEIRSKARRLKMTHGVDLVIIDYLQLMSSGKRAENRQQEVSEFSRSCKLLAKELDVPVVVLSQLNRGPEQRTDKRPMLSDLRESGSLEQDADVVVLVHRPELYEPEGCDRAGEADLIIAKHRSGPLATVAVEFHGRYCRFRDFPN